MSSGSPPFGLLATRRATVLGLLAGTLFPQPARAEDFDTFLAGMRGAALARGTRPATVDRAFIGLTPNPRVIALDRRQAGGGGSFARYRERIVSPRRIRDGRERFRRHAALLGEIGQDFGVQPRVLLALWGIESSYGRVTGDFEVVRSLATLAHDGRRRELFTDELLAALTILDQTPLDVASMQGSWAGAMGQAQFLPTTYLNHAVDRDRNGWADIWSSQPDVFASMAGYLRSIGWREGWKWGRRVNHPSRFIGLPEGREERRPLAFWANAGVRRGDGGPLPIAETDAALVMPDGATGEAFLVYDNFHVLRTWNRSTYFALSVGLLSDSF